MTRRTGAIITLFCLVLITTVLAQQTSLRVNVRLVNVFLTVTDATGRYVDGLNKEDFAVQEDGIPQEIAHFSHDLDVPVSVGIVLDTSGSMQNKLRTAVGAVDRFVRTIHPEDDIFVMTFASSSELRQDFTDDRAKLSKALRSLNASGATSLYDALSQSLEKIKSGKHRKRAILLLTDGQDTGSATTYGEVMQQVRETELLIYTLGVSVGSYGPAGGRDSFDMDVLQDIASEAGGRAFLLSDILVGPSGSQLERVLNLIAQELRSQYTLAFYTNHADDDRFHSLRVRARPGLVTRSRPGYIAKSNSIKK